MSKPQIDSTEPFEGLGDVRVNHVCVEVAVGMMIAATTILKKFGYKEDPSRRIAGDLFSARFMVRPGSIDIQLTEPAEENSEMAIESHLALEVENPKLVVDAIERLLSRTATDQGLEIEAVGGGKYFVTMPRFFMIPIELVPGG